MSFNSKRNSLENAKMLEHEEKYVRYKPVKIFCGTYNLNGKRPDESLIPWLFAKGNDIDLYAIGFQEVVDLTTTSLLLRTDWIEKETALNQLILDELAEICAKHNLKRSYKLLTRTKMFGLFLFIYVSNTINDQLINDVTSSYVPTGILNVGNKGSVGVSLRLGDTRVCFVCSHFAADTDKLEKRNSDFRTTRQMLKFQYTIQDEHKAAEQEQSFLLDLDQHDTIFWFGDLNYRLDSLSLNDTIKLIHSNAFDTLLENDQLTTEMKRYRVFEFFEEGRIHFRPTYKYIPKTDCYERQAQALAQNTAQPAQTKSSDDLNDDFISAISANASVPRVKLPSWTDRVLWKTVDIKVDLLHYSCVNMLTISDHKPVYALFVLNYKEIDQVALRKVRQLLLSESDRKVNEEMPRISVDKFELKFGECMFYDTKTQFMQITNDGLTRSNVDILFYDPHKKDVVHANQSSTSATRPHRSNQWVSIFPQHRERLDSKSTYSVELSTSFNQSQLARMNKQQTVDDFLIVRCLNGNDIFVTISCEYKPSIIGWSLKALSTLGEQESFEACDISALRDSVEQLIAQFEENIDSFYSNNLKKYFADKQKERLLDNGNEFEAMLRLGNVASSSPSENVVKSKIDIYKQYFNHIKSEMVGKDAYFFNDLSNEYKFLINHLIQRCSVDDEPTIHPSNQTSQLTIEEQKNLILKHLSTKSFAEFEQARFDMELLVEILNDLLHALPHSLIPTRFLDYCSYAQDSYDEMVRILLYIPKSHTTLFNLLVKFLKAYSAKCQFTLNSNRLSSDSSSNVLSIASDSSTYQVSDVLNYLAAAIFKLNRENMFPVQQQTRKEQITVDREDVDLESYQHRLAVKFLKLSLQFHTDTLQDK